MQKLRIKITYKYFGGISKKQQKKCSHQKRMLQTKINKNKIRKYKYIRGHCRKRIVKVF